MANNELYSKVTNLLTKADTKDDEVVEVLLVIRTKSADGQTGIILGAEDDLNWYGNISMLNAASLLAKQSLSFYNENEPI